LTLSSDAHSARWGGAFDLVWSGEEEVEEEEGREKRREEGR